MTNQIDKVIFDIILEMGLQISTKKNQCFLWPERCQQRYSRPEGFLTNRFLNLKVSNPTGFQT